MTISIFDCRFSFLILLMGTAMATEVKLPSLPLQETIMDKSGWVYVITRDFSTLTYYPDGGWECKSSIMQYDQQTYLKMIYQNADKGNWMRKLAMLSRYWVYKPTPWEAMGITKDQYDDWLATGTLKTQAELDAAKAAKEADEQKQVAAAIAKSDIIDTVNGDGSALITRNGKIAGLGSAGSLF